MTRLGTLEPVAVLMELKAGLDGWPQTNEEGGIQGSSAKRNCWLL